MSKLSPAMIAMLRSTSAGLSIMTGLHGRSAHGGAIWTIQALQKRGLLGRDLKITTEGLAEVARWAQRQAP